MPRRSINVFRGVLFGGLAVLIGMIFAYLLGPPDMGYPYGPRWVRASLYFLGAHHIQFPVPLHIGDTVAWEDGNIIELTNEMRMLYVLPPILMTATAVVTGVSGAASATLLDGIQDCLGAAYGYIGALSVLRIEVVVREAIQPGQILQIGFVLIVALVVARFANRFDKRDATITNIVGSVFLLVPFAIALGGGSLHLVAIIFGGVLVGSILLTGARLLQRSSLHSAIIGG